jgi:hypothetical protein
MQQLENYIAGQWVKGSGKGTDLFNKQWEDELNKRAIICGALNYKELVYNPKFYY